MESGIAPQTVAQHCGSRSNSALIFVEGEVGHDDFVRLATAARAANDKRFDPIRFFCGDDELLRVGGHTYAFSNQWGGSGWLEAMSNLRDAFPDCGIAFTPAG